jgi:uncharacterized membrane protein
MAFGRLGVAELTADTDTEVYTASTGAAVSILVLNAANASAKVKLAIVDGAVADLANEDFIEDTTLPAKDVLERTQIVLGEGETVVVRSDVAGVVVRVHGYEE